MFSFQNQNTQLIALLIDILSRGMYIGTPKAINWLGKLFYHILEGASPTLRLINMNLSIGMITFMLQRTVIFRNHAGRISLGVQYNLCPILAPSDVAFLDARLSTLWLEVSKSVVQGKQIAESNSVPLFYLYFTRGNIH